MSNYFQGVSIAYWMFHLEHIGLLVSPDFISSYSPVAVSVRFIKMFRDKLFDMFGGDGAIFSILQNFRDRSTLFRRSQFPTRHLKVPLSNHNSTAKASKCPFMRGVICALKVSS